MPANANPDPFDPRQIPQTERIAYVNALAGPPSPDNARDLYDAATKAFKSLYDMRPLHCHSAEDADQKRTPLNERFLMLAESWPDEVRTQLRAWLSANAKTITALAAATDQLTFSAPLVSPTNRLHDVALERTAVLPRCARLLAIQANHAAQSDDWPAAYAWNDRIFRIANHLYQPPLLFHRIQAVGIEQLAATQLLVFLSRQVPTDPTQLLSRLAHQEARACPNEVLAKALRLADLDHIEATFEWAADPQKWPQIGAFVAMMSKHAKALPGAQQTQRCSTVGEFRAALLMSSVDRAWEVEVKRDALRARWEAQPFAQAWRTARQLRDQMAAVSSDSPFHRMLDSFSGPPYEQRYFYAVTRTRRNAAAFATAVLHYQEQRDCLPRDLDDLRSLDVAFDATDLFSGQPLCYSTTENGLNFELHSVGPGQTSAGATDCCDERAAGDQPQRAASDFKYWPPVLPKDTEGG